MTDTSPMHGLSGLLADDMKAVNARIVACLSSDVPLIGQLAGYLIAAGGKRIRPLLTLASTKLAGGDMARAVELATAVEFIHSATLLHDDVVDESMERRGQASANEVFGNQSSVLVGDYLFSRAFQLMVGDGSLDVLRILSTASATIAEGEVMQLQMQNNLATGWEQYTRMIDAKTSALFAAACEVGAVIAGCDAQKCEALRKYGHALGTAFQIADDMLDYGQPGEGSKLGKTLGDDFREGKITAPVLLAYEVGSAEEKKFWQRTIEQNDQNEDDFHIAQSYIAAHGIADKVRDRALFYAQSASDRLTGFSADNDLKEFMTALPAYAALR